MQIGQWLVKQRSSYRRGTLAPERVAALDALRIEWDPIEAGWRRDE
ncbi:helicase associated domain-containing protein [Kitasatospora sp. NPDC087314]